MREPKTVEDFYLQLSMIAGSKMEKKESTLVFIDEIQVYTGMASEVGE